MKRNHLPLANKHQTTLAVVLTLASLLVLASCQTTKQTHWCPDTETFVQNRADCPSLHTRQASTSVHVCPPTCDDKNPCTQDACSNQTGNQCVHTRIPNCCQSSKDCKTPRPFCVKNRCTSCAIDNHCPNTHPFCIDGECFQEKTCAAISDCPPDYTCTQGTCTLLSCTTSNECANQTPNTPYCLRGKCSPFQCVTDDDCPYREACIEGNCLRTCTRDEDCTSPFEVCKENTCTISQQLKNLAACKDAFTDWKQAVCYGVALARNGNTHAACKELLSHLTGQERLRQQGWCTVGFVSHTNETSACKSIKTSNLESIASLRQECYDNNVNWTARLGLTTLFQTKSTS